MNNLSLKRILMNYFAVTAYMVMGISVFTSQASARTESGSNELVIIRQPCDDSLVMKYNRTVDKYKAMMKNPQGMLVNDYSIKATQEDRDSLLNWYSRMTDTQQYYIWPYPNKDGKFVPSPFSVFEDEAGRVRAGGVWITKEQGKYHAYNYLLVVDGEILDRRVRLDSFNVDKATVKQFAWLIGLTPQEIVSVEVMDRDLAMGKWGYKGCNGAIIMKTTGAIVNPIILVDDRVMNVKLAPDADVKDMSVNDFSRLLKIPAEYIKSLRISERAQDVRNTPDSIGRAMIVQISTIDWVNTK